MVTPRPLAPTEENDLTRQDPLRDDSRFHDLLLRMNLKP